MPQSTVTLFKGLFQQPKALFLPCLLLLLSLNSLGQTINYVRTWTPMGAEQDPGTLINSARGMRDVQQATAYFDGLGRPIQTVIKKGALNGTDSADLVSPEKYDGFGREPKKYLSYVSTQNNGLYK